MDFIYRAVSRSMPENIGHILYVWPHWTVHRSTQRVSPPCVACSGSPAPGSPSCAVCRTAAARTGFYSSRVSVSVS